MTQNANIFFWTFQPTSLFQSTRLLSSELRVLIGKRQLLLDHPQFGTQVLSQLMPCPFTGPKMFWAGPNVLGWTKFFVPDQKFIYILWQSHKFCASKKNQFY